MLINDDPISTYTVLVAGEQLQLNPNYEYTLYHRGTDATNTADANDILVLSKGGVTPGYGAGNGKGVFKSGMTMVVRGIDGIYLKVAAGAPCVTVLNNGLVNKLKG